MHIFLTIWFSLTALSLTFVAYDLIKNTTEIKAMKWEWVIITLYLGIFGQVVYILSCDKPARNTPERLVSPFWIQTVGSTIHFKAGDAIPYYTIVIWVLVQGLL